VIAQVDAGAIEPALERFHGDAKTRRRLGRAQLLDIAQQHDLPMQGIQIRKSRGEQLGAASQGDSVLRIDYLREQVVLAAVEAGRPAAMSVDEPEALAANHREEPTRDRRSGAAERAEGTGCRPERLLDGVLNVFGRTADLQPETVNALAVHRDQLVQGADVASLSGREEGVS
jgi:hypothetical protein